MAALSGIHGSCTFRFCRVTYEYLKSLTKGLEHLLEHFLHGKIAPHKHFKFYLALNYVTDCIF